MKIFRVKLANEHFTKLGSGNRPRHKLDFEAADLKAAWKEAFKIVENFNMNGGIKKPGCFGSQDMKDWADWKIVDVCKI